MCLVAVTQKTWYAKAHMPPSIRMMSEQKNMAQQTNILLNKDERA